MTFEQVSEKDSNGLHSCEKEIEQVNLCLTVYFNCVEIFCLAILKFNFNRKQIHVGGRGERNEDHFCRWGVWERIDLKGLVAKSPSP